MYVVTYNPYLQCFRNTLKGLASFNAIVFLLFECMGTLLTGVPSVDCVYAVLCSCYDLSMSYERPHT